MGKHNENTTTVEEQCLSKSELSGYTDGSLEAIKHSRVIAHLESCEMCSMAVKGYATAPSLAMLGVLDNDLNELVEAKFSPSTGWSFQHVLNVILGAVVIGGAVFFFSNRPEPIEEVVAFIPEEQVEESSAIEASEEATPSPFPKSEPQPQPEASTAAEPKTVEPREELMERMLSISYMPLKQMDETALDPLKGSEVFKAKISTNTKYVHDMKTYDYEKFYQREHEYTWYNPDLGVPAQYAHSTDVITYENGPDYKTIWRTYESILNTALAEYKRRKYDKALASLNLLLDDYPSDINGLFYKGLCLFYTKKYEKSIRYMTSVAADVNPTFDQEAEWFVALAHLKLKERDTAIKDLKAIIRYDGFYKEEAIRKLHEIE